MEPRRKIATGMPAAFAAAALAWPAGGQAAVPEGFAIESVALLPAGSQPTGFACLPDGRVLVLERITGRVHLAATTSTATVVVATIPGVASQGERGLLGVAVDPGWPARPYVYFQHTHVDSTTHVTMYTASGDLVDPASTNLALGAPYLLLGDVPDLRNTHNGGTLRFGPDGHLYVSLGDDVRGCDAQDLDLPAGKILRLDVPEMPGPGPGPPPHAALVPADNPYAGGDWRRLVFARGLRNPYRFTIDAETGNLYIGDVGLLTWEEIDELVRAGYDGDNFGWPEYEGPLQDPDPLTSDCSSAPFVAPIHVYPNPPAGVVAVIGGPRLRARAGMSRPFPRAYDGDVFLADFYGGWIQRLRLDGAAWSVADSTAGQPNAAHWAEISTQISDLQQGPDGALWFASFIQGNVGPGVHRMVNTLPSDVQDAGVPHARVHPNPARRGSTVTFRIEAPSSRNVHLAIFDAAGRRLRSLRAASPIATWDGRTGDGAPAAPGVYLFELWTDSGVRAHGKVAVAP